jgi:hypothetical protein
LDLQRLDLAAVEVCQQIPALLLQFVGSRLPGQGVRDEAGDDDRDEQQQR